MIPGPGDNGAAGAEQPYVLPVVHELALGASRLQLLRGYSLPRAEHRAGAVPPLRPARERGALRGAGAAHRAQRLRARLLGGETTFIIINSF